eukprot:g274.t1
MPTEVFGHWLPRTSNVRWCEDVVRPYGDTPWVAETFNTVSNALFIVVSIYGLAEEMRRKRLYRRSVFVFTHACLVVVGLGSFLFHCTQNKWAEFLDELPMSIMAVGYVCCLRDLHWSTTTSTLAGKLVYSALFFNVASSWVAYLILHNFKIFEICFTIQVLVPALVSFAAAGSEVSRANWWWFLAAIGVGKGAWEYERLLFRTGTCPEEMTSISFWFHPMWHVAAAASHYFWMQYAAELVEAASEGDRKKATRSGSAATIATAVGAATAMPEKAGRGSGRGGREGAEEMDGDVARRQTSVPLRRSARLSARNNNKKRE